ncbi:facilitated trehalose transporter Tret1 isoform X2 [Anoplophora glabripennis]|nr:facilitated trehalose transporter Tret1 isoform X2 [Anoplophora glabripennis]XP_018573952.1 facilitated trehalose transporter Tret1 isoform X2 [Anoplophora glabripennis]XP_018573953.1 facilitated trehalose transporter Tret1 isoform X2 [Anoplophora glabripennis]
MGDSQGKKLPQYIAALSVCLGSVAAGTVLGWTSNISDKLRNSELNDIFIDLDAVGWIGSFATIGGMLMCFPIGYICDLIGRKWGCITTVVPFTVGWLLIIFAANTGMIYAGRFLTGLAGGAFCVAAPIYTSEIAQKEIRGTLGSFFQLLLTCGILLSYVAGAYMSPRNLSILCAVIPIVFAVVFFFQPETPVYFLKNQKPAAALDSLQRLRGPTYNCDDEIKEIKDTLDQDASIKVSFFEAMRTTASKKALLICFGLMFFQQMSGVNAVIFYTKDIFESSGSTLPASTATIIVGVMQVIATFISSVSVDRFGRKILLLGSVLFMMLSGLILGVFFSLKDRNVLDADGVDKISFLPILCLIIFICAFSLGFGPIPWLISAELMPQEIKSTACSAAATFNWLLAFIVTRFYGNLSDAIGGDSTFYIFAGLSLLGTLFVFFVVPETKGKSYAEVQALLGGGSITEPTNKDNKDGIDNPGFANN